MACIYTKQFSETPSNPNKVVGQIMKTSSGKPLFQIIAVTEDMELAGKTKNTLLKMGYADSKEEVKTFAKGTTFAIFDKNERVLDLDGNFVDFQKCSPDEIEYFEDKNEAIKRAKEVNGSVKQFARSFGAPQPISVHGRTFYILGFNNKEYAIQDEKGQNILGDLKTQGVDWNTIVYWLRKQGANTSKAEALKLCVDERTTSKGVIIL